MNVTWWQDELGGWLHTACGSEARPLPDAVECLRCGALWRIPRRQPVTVHYAYGRAS